MKHKIKLQIEVDIDITTGASRGYLEQRLLTGMRLDILNPLMEVMERMLPTNNEVTNINYKLDFLN